MKALLKWRAPTHYTTGQTIRVPLTYNVYYFQAHGISTPLDPILEGVTDTWAVIELAPHQDACFCVRAVANGVRSHISDIVCRHVPV